MPAPMKVLTISEDDKLIKAIPTKHLHRLNRKMSTVKSMIPFEFVKIMVTVGLGCTSWLILVGIVDFSRT